MFDTKPPELKEEDYLSHTLSIQIPPQGSWDVHVNRTIRADAFLRKCGYRHDLELNQLIHALSWHHGLDPVRWLNEFEEIAFMMIQKEDIPFSDINVLIQASIAKLKQG